MKKVLAVLAVAVTIAACNNSGAEVEGSASPKSADSATAKAADTVKAAASDSASMKKDSAAKDTTKKM